MTETYKPGESNDAEVKDEERREAEEEKESAETVINRLASYQYGYLFMQSKNTVGLGGLAVSKILEKFYAEGYRYAVVGIDLPGDLALVPAGRIYRRGGYYWLRPFNPEQRILRTLLEKYRGDVWREKKTYPVRIISIDPLEHPPERPSNEEKIPFIYDFTEDVINNLADLWHGYLFMQSRNTVGLGGRAVSKILDRYYEELKSRYATAVIQLPGDRLLVLSGRIYYRENKHGRYYWLRPRGIEQKVLRMILEKYRRDATPRRKKTYPVAVLMMAPALVKTSYGNGAIDAFEVPPEEQY